MKVFGFFPIPEAAARFLRNPLLHRVIRNSGYLFSATGLSAGLSMVQSILAARLLGVEGFGVLGAITVFASVINRLTSFRMSDLVIRYVGEFSAEGDEERAAAVFKAASLTEIGSSLLAYLILFLLAPLGAAILVNDVSLAWLFSLYGLIVIANLMAESAVGLLQYLDQYRLIAGLTVAQSVITLLLILAAILAQLGLVAILVAYLIGKTVWAMSISLMALVHARRHWGPGWWKAPISLLSGRGREIAGFAMNTNVTGSLTLLTRDSEILWLSALSNPTQVGYYKVTLAILNFLLIPIQPLINTTYREVAREIGQKQWVNVRYLLRSGSMIAATYSVPATALLAVFGPWVVSLWGREFLPTAYTSLLILLPGVTVINVLYWNRTVLLPLGFPRTPTLTYFWAAMIKIGLIILIVPSLGANGMALLLSGFFVFTSVFLVLKTRSELKRASGSSLAGVSQ